jgi:hypothetical protein
VAGWGDKDVRMDKAMKGDGWRNLMEVTSLGCREERLHAYHIGQRLAIFWRLFKRLHAQTNYLQDRYRYSYLQILHPQIQSANKNLVIL